jgi:ParB/RepB/Spo0J family partition protein
VSHTLEARLVASSIAKSDLTEGCMIKVPLESLEANPFQPRRVIEEAALVELAESIKQNGLSSSINVSPLGDGRYRIIAGHRRTEAFKKLLEGAETDAEKAKWFEIPAIVTLAADERRLVVSALHENQKRTDLTAIEVARSYQGAIDAGLFGSVKELAASVQASATVVQRHLRLLKCEPFLQEAVEAGVNAEGPSGKEKTRRLDHMACLALQSLFERLKGESPQRAEKTVRQLMLRSLVENWPLRKLEDRLKGQAKGETSADAPPSDTAENSAESLVKRTARSWSLSLQGLRSASGRDSALREFQALLAEFERVSADATDGSPAFSPASPTASESNHVA